MYKNVHSIITLIVLGILVTSCNDVINPKMRTNNDSSSQDIIDPTFNDPNEGSTNPSSTYTQKKENYLSSRIHPPMSVTHKGHGETQ